MLSSFYVNFAKTGESRHKEEYLIHRGSRLTVADSSKCQQINSKYALRDLSPSSVHFQNDPVRVLLNSYFKFW